MFFNYYPRELEEGMQLLFRQRPDHIQKLEEWMEERFGRDAPIGLRRICVQGHLEAEQRKPL